MDDLIHEINKEKYIDYEVRIKKQEIFYKRIDSKLNILIVLFSAIFIIVLMHSLKLV